MRILKEKCRLFILKGNELLARAENNRHKNLMKLPIFVLTRQFLRFIQTIRQECKVRNILFHTDTNVAQSMG